MHENFVQLSVDHTIIERKISMDRFGIQLYSVKNEIKELGFDAVLGMIKRAGYDCVEFAGFYGYSPDEVVALLDKHGLEGISAHMGIDVIEPSLEYIDKIGIKRVYIPAVDRTMPYEDRVNAFRRLKALLDERGIIFGYHNHHMEYANGADEVYDYINAIDGFTSQLDVFWAKVGGHEPTELMQKYGDKLSCLHIKDLDTRWTPGESVNDYPCAIIGEGQANCEGAMKLGKKMGIDTFILEVEGFPCDPEEYLTKSCNNMKKFAKEN